MSGDKINSVEELRRRAEKRLQRHMQKVTAPASLAELQRIVHELEVHQIELEMQNEELHQARSELESFLVQYTDLYDFAPVGYFTLNISGLILQVNLTGARMLEVDRSRLVNQHFLRFIAADSRPVFTAFLAKIFNSHSQGTSVIRLQKKGGGTIFVHVEARIRKDGQECLTALIDITAQKQAEELLRESERKYRTLFENMVQGVVLYGQSRKIISANPAAERILGLTLDQMRARTPTDLHWKTIHEDGTDFPGETHPSMVAFRTGKAMHNVVIGFLSPKTDHYIWLNVNAVPQFMPGEDRPFQVIITFEDITFLKRLAVYNKLTAREKEVFKLLAKGLGRKIIAEILNIRPKTVDKHRENLMEKLNLHEKEELMLFVKLIGLV
jgi:PAS domain S-box-containing protein